MMHQWFIYEIAFHFGFARGIGHDCNSMTQTAFAQSVSESNEDTPKKAGDVYYNEKQTNKLIVEI